ncbi:MAG TPA: serine hydrolase domain-containing protein [Longimicrobium sp.]|jgi:CubicO group peptidase (beta-lactamase class C family)
MWKSLPALATAVLCGVAPVRAQLPEAQVTTIEQAITSTMSRLRIPGLSIAISRDGDIVYERAFGMTDLENSVPARTTTVYRIASNVKPITAAAVMQLVERGRIDLDAPIQMYVPDYPRKRRPITVRQLLTHTSGVRHHKDDAEYHTTRHCDQLKQALEMFGRDSLLHAPGEKVTYSTYGYVLLGLAVEGASGMRYIDYLREHIFRPAGMSRTRADEVTDIIPNRASGYGVTSAGALRNAKLVDTSCRMPGGGIVSSAGDMARFLAALSTGALLSRESVARMQTNQLSAGVMERTLAGVALPPGYRPPGFGFGWAIGTDARPDAVWHGGNQQGATSIIYWVPDARVGVAVLTNLENQGTELENLVESIAEIVAPNRQGAPPGR